MARLKETDFPYKTLWDCSVQYSFEIVGYGAFENKLLSKFFLKFTVCVSVRHSCVAYFCP